MTKSGDYLSIGERISSLRNKKNLSQNQLAKALDLSRQAISKWENDITAPDTLNLIRLADLLDCSVEYLATGKQESTFVPATDNPLYQQSGTVEKIIEKPIEVERIVEKVVYIDKLHETVIEKPVIRRVFRYKYVRNSLEYISMLILGIGIGIAIGIMI